MKVVIIEDEKFAQEKLERMLRGLVPTIEICAKLESVAQSVVWLQANEVDLIFMDIHLADGSAFSIFEKIDVSAPIVFTTAYDEYALRAFKVNSIDYLLKPISKPDLEFALTQYKKHNDTATALKFVFSQMKMHKPVYQERFMITQGDRIVSIATQSILYFFAEGKYAFLVDESGNQYVIDYTLDKLLPLLDEQLFFRVNRSHIIRLQAIEKMVVWTKSRIKVHVQFCAEPLVVSTERAGAFKQWLNR